MTDLFDQGDLEVIDRSTLEDWSLCPFRGWAVETGKVSDSSLAAVAGTEAHRAIAYGLDLFVRGEGFDVDLILDELMKSRPDVQKEAVAGAPRYALWQFKKMLLTRNKADILRYQGGEDKHSGQVGREIVPGVKLTQELDLLLAGFAATELIYIDIKSGHTPYTSAQLRDNFQALHANWTIRGMYDGIEKIGVQFVMPRLGDKTGVVWFTERDATMFQGRATEIVRIRAEALATGEAECWPAYGRCENCAAVLICDAAYPPAKDIASDPPAFFARLHVKKTALDLLMKDATAYVRGNGPVTFDGGVFGEKPPSNRKPTVGFLKA